MRKDLNCPEYVRHFTTFPHLHRLKPFKMVGNLFFAGNDNVGVHIIDTGDGLIMIDTAFPETQALLIQSIWELGFNPKDIKIIMHTHAHVDHMGTTNLLTALSDAKTYISAADAKMIREDPEMTFAAEGIRFVPDHELQDGEIVRLGNTSVRTVYAPGHTMGTVAYFATVTDDNGKQYIAGMHGGIGLNTLNRAFIEEHNLPKARECYVNSLDKLMNEHVDIVMGNHTQQNRTEEKYAQLISSPSGPNPFIDPYEWKTFLSKTKEAFFKMLESEK